MPKFLIKFCEELFEAFCSFVVDLESNFTCYFTQKLNFAKIFIQIRFYLCICVLAGFNHRYFVASSKSLFKEQRSAQTHHLAVCHDSDTVAKDICLVHVVGSKNDDFITSVVFEHVPEVPTCS